MTISFLLVVVLLAVPKIGTSIPLQTIDYLVKSVLGTAEIAFGIRGAPTTLDRIAVHGYPVEHHSIKTEDGYILGVFRMPHSHKLQNQKNYRPIVIFQHGLMGASDYWVFVGPHDGLPYMLVDCGFDVWLGNSRGNLYSRRHSSCSADKRKFWRFSWHEIGYYDIAATIDYSLETNGQGQKSIHYVGHSQGTTVFFALMSTRPEYNKKIKTAHMFAPVAIMTNMKSRLVRKLSPYLGRWQGWANLFASTEFLPYNKYWLKLFSKICGPNKIFRPVCVYLIQAYYNKDNWNNTALVEGIGNQPAGVSFNQILHYMQIHRSRRFRRFDYGPKRNKKRYNLDHPPEYPIENITANVHLWYSDNDVMAAVQDVLALADRLPNRELHHMSDPKWDHDDFILSKKVRKTLNEPVMKIMETFEKP